MKTATEFSVPDIVCDGCAASIKNALGKVSGIESVKVDVAAKIVTVEHDAQIGREKLAEVLDDAGYEVE